MMEKETLRVAVAQTRATPGDLAQNLALHLDLIADARRQHVALLLFPELSLTGYGLGDRVQQVALRRDDRLLGQIAQAAGETLVAFGFVEEGPGAQLYNAAALVRAGRILHVHRKINLPTYGRLEEGKLFATGAHVETLALDRNWRAATLICADLWNPALVHLAMLRKATLLLAPVNSALGAVGKGFSNPDSWPLALRFYALVYGVPVLMANRMDTEGEAEFWGGSCILDPYGQVVAQVEADTPGIAWADLDYVDVRKARFRLPTLRDSTPRLVAGEMQRILSEPDCGGVDPAGTPGQEPF